MLRYVARRLLQMVPVFFGATLLIYAMVFALAPKIGRASCRERV